MSASLSSPRVELLGLLTGERGSIVSGGRLAERLGCSRQAVSKRVASLAEEGIPVEAEPRRGYRLTGAPAPERFSPTWAELALADCRLGHPVVLLPRVTTTQAVAADLARQGAAGGLAVVAEDQYAGRGRRGRSWSFPIGRGLAFSLLLRPDLPQRLAPLFSLASALGVAEATENLCGLRPTLKWPNDLLLGGKKFCGILCESAGEPDRIAHVIAGIGINVRTREEDFPPDVRTTATSILIASGREVPRTDLFAETLRALAKAYALLEDADEGRLIGAYRERCDTVGQEVRVITDEGAREGTAEGIGPEGALLVRIGGEVRPFHAADVVHLRRADPGA